VIFDPYLPSPYVHPYAIFDPYLYPYLPSPYVHPYAIFTLTSTLTDLALTSTLTRFLNLTSLYHYVCPYVILTLMTTLTTVNRALPSTLTALNRYSPYRSKPNPCKSQKG
jgi:hypothetical protein